MVSKSPERNSFQITSYLKRCETNEQELDNDILKVLEETKENHTNRWNDPKTRENNLEWDLLTTDWILEKVRASKSYAQNLYAAMCNNDFQKLEVIPILTKTTWSCSWRYAGGIIADMRQSGDYIDWYCTGIRDTSIPSEEEWNSWKPEEQQNWTNIYSKYVPESVITDEIKQDLKKLGWIVIED